MKYKHITKAIADSTKFWNDIMKQKCIDFNQNFKEYDDPRQKIGTRLMTEYIDDSYDLRMSFFNRTKNDIEKEIFYISSKQDKITFIKNRIEKLKVEYESNSFSHEFPIYSYLTDLPTERLPFHIFQALCIPYDKKKIIYNTIHPNMDIFEFEELLGKYSSGYEVLHHLATSIHIYLANLNALLADNDSNRIEKVEKDYYLVFKNKYCRDLFIFCLKEYDENDITKTLISKYFNLFVGKGYIIKSHALNIFFQFVKNNFSIKMHRLESYTSSISNERDRFKNLESNFLKRTPVNY